MESLQLSGENISVNLVSFYHGVIGRENISNDIWANQFTLNTLRSAYSRKLRSNDPCAISFDSADVRNAYVFQFCPSFSLAMAYNFWTFLKSVSRQQLQRLVSKDTLVICCPGGGPGTDVVAICVVLQEVRKYFAPTAKNPLLIDATIVDVEPGWSSTAELVVGSLPDLVDESVVKINHFRFIEHDLTTGISPDIAEGLRQCDIVTMNKFLSALHGPKDRITDIFTDTWNHMPEGSILFLMDSSGWNVFYEMVRIAGSFDQLEHVYGPVQMSSRLSQPSQRLCLSLYASIYGDQCCTAHTSNKAAAWIKMSSSDTI